MATFCYLLYRKLANPDTNNTAPSSCPMSLCQIIKTRYYLLYLFFSLLLHHVKIIVTSFNVDCYLNDMHYVVAID